MTGLLTDIYEECETRTEFGREKPRPIVKIPLTSDFNEEVCIDLKEWKLKDYRYILCMVDKYTRYTGTLWPCLLETKKLKLFVQQ